MIGSRLRVTDMSSSSDASVECLGRHPVCWRRLFWFALLPDILNTLLQCMIACNAKITQLCFSFILARFPYPCRKRGGQLVRRRPNLLASRKKQLRFNCCDASKRN